MMSQQDTPRNHTVVYKKSNSINQSTKTLKLLKNNMPLKYGDDLASNREQYQD